MAAFVESPSCIKRKSKSSREWRGPYKHRRRLCCRVTVHSHLLQIFDAFTKHTQTGARLSSITKAGMVASRNTCNMAHGDRLCFGCVLIPGSGACRRIIIHWHMPILCTRAGLLFTTFPAGPGKNHCCHHNAQPVYHFHPHQRANALSRICGEISENNKNNSLKHARVIKGHHNTSVKCADKRFGFWSRSCSCTHVCFFIATV